MTIPHSADYMVRMRQIVQGVHEAYAFRMSNDSKPLSHLREGHMRLIALLMYATEQKKKSQAAAEQLFRRLMLPRRN
jgi:hypothetical protein